VASLPLARSRASECVGVLCLERRRGKKAARVSNQVIPTACARARNARKRVCVRQGGGGAGQVGWEVEAVRGCVGAGRPLVDSPSREPRDAMIAAEKVQRRRRSK
jgi:hypothetical protein